MFSRLFLLFALVVAAAARRAPAPATAPSFWTIETAASEVLAEAATGAPEPRAEAMMPKKSSTPFSIAAAPAPSKHHHHHPRGSSSTSSSAAAASQEELDAAEAEAELEAVAVAANAFAEIAAGAQEVEALMGEEQDDEMAMAASLALPTFLEVHEEGDPAAPPLPDVPAEALAQHGLVAVGDDAIFAAADSAASMATASTAAAVSAPITSTEDLEAALEAAAETGSAVVVLDEAN